MIEEIRSFILDNCLQGFNYIVFGDGSGHTMNSPYGYHSIVYDCSKNTIAEYSGMGSNGTNNISEIMPAISFLTVYQSPCSVLFVTDSQITEGCGNRRFLPKANEILWASIDKAREMGYNMKWVWRSRNSNPMLKRCDELSKEARLLFIRSIINGEAK